jgi:formamidopyrimidine-DNA glycosylase
VQHRAYGREHEPCTVCGAPIRKILVAQRGTHFCPRCQRR